MLIVRGIFFDGWIEWTSSSADDLGEMGDRIRVKLAQLGMGGV